MGTYHPLRDVPQRHKYGSGDVLVVFGELFQRGYANGIVDEAKKAGMKIIYSTVGRRDENLQLRCLTSDELREKEAPLVNVPLEAGFDLEPSKQGPSPVDQLKGIKLSHWESAELDFAQVEESQKAGRIRFRKAVQDYLVQLEKEIPESANVLFVHTMAGGFPRAKVVMPAANRVFKGSGPRYFSSQTFWESDIGRLCERNFQEVTGETLYHLLDLSSELRNKIEGRGRTVRYVSYGYHGTEILMKDHYQWQSYAPYLQGWAKLRLEEIAKEFWEKGVQVSVFNAPEILTNSSGIFLGVEVSLYPLIRALKKECENKEKVDRLFQACEALLLEEHSLDELLDGADLYFAHPEIKKLTEFSTWPQHNFETQMNLMRDTSSKFLEIHKSDKELIVANLSEVVFQACGRLMIDRSQDLQSPVWWLGHDVIAKVFGQLDA
ncbi:MAG: hypothetical protein KDD61_09575 [Bdellovibrionales bacterium]|nr:hypothetical protein [Bdellovibrionales bacterium]